MSALQVSADGFKQWLLGRIQQTPDLYLEELADELEEHMDKKVSIATISRVLRAHGLTRKTVCFFVPACHILIVLKITKAARERDEMKRAEYSRRIAKYLPEERVYVDESRFDRRAAIRTKAWSLAGSRSLKTVFFLRGMR
jgi:hypothetical protein